MRPYNDTCFEPDAQQLRFNRKGREAAARKGRRSLGTSLRYEVLGIRYQVSGIRLQILESCNREISD